MGALIPIRDLFCVAAHIVLVRADMYHAVGEYLCDLAYHSVDSVEGLFLTETYGKEILLGVTGTGYIKLHCDICNVS